MFCSECGTKNAKGAGFCEKCGAKLEGVEAAKENKPKEPKKPMSKKSKIIIALVSIAVVCLVVLYVIGSSLTKPEKIVEKYYEALKNQDFSELYQYVVDVKDGDTTFVSKEAFEALGKENKMRKITNYTIGEFNEDKSGLTGKVKVEYTEEGSSGTKEDTVNLKKADGSAYLIFDKWIIDAGGSKGMTVKDYQIKVPTGSKVVFSGIDVDKKYINKNKSSDSYDVYVLPQVFTAKTRIKVTLKSGIVIEDTDTPSEYYNSYTARLTSSSISDEFKKKLVDQSKDDLKDIFSGVINNTEFDKLNNSNFDKSLAESYNSYLSTISSNSRKLKKLDITKADYYSLSSDDENVKLTIKMTYDYTVNYTSGTEEKTKDGNSYTYVYLTYDISGKTFKLKNISSLPTYFSIY